MQKRVALLFCGRVRAHEYCHPTFQKHIVTPLRNAGYEYDSFLSHSTTQIDSSIQNFIENNRVISYEMTLPNNNHLSYIPLHKDRCGRALSYVMFYHWNNAYRLMKEYSERTGVQYDMIIYMRADQQFISDLIIPEPILPNTVYIPYGYDWDGLNDQFAMGDINSIRIFTDLYNNVDRIYNKTRVNFHTETYVQLYLEDANINVIRFPLQYRLHPARI